MKTQLVVFSDLAKLSNENDCWGLSIISLFSSIGSVVKMISGIVFCFLLNKEAKKSFEIERIKIDLRLSEFRER